MSQHPRFEAFKSAWRAGDDAQALVHIDAVLADHPLVASLHWYRANCLQRLDRCDEARAAVERVLALKPDHAAALVRQVELDNGMDDMEDIGDEEPSEKATAEYERRAAARRQRHIAQLRQAIALDPKLADACFVLSQLLRYADMHDPKLADDEADTLLARAIDLAPDRVEFIAARADLYRMRALQVPENTPPDQLVQTQYGMPYLRAPLEAALRDFEHCARLDDTSPRYLARVANIQHELGHFDAALAAYDRALERVPADSPHREHLLAMRARSENNGAGGRDEMAKLLEGIIAQGDRNQADDQVATMLLGAARAVRRGQTLSDAVSARLPESPDDFTAANIAEQILNVAFEDPPNLIEADAATFPSYQRNYIARQRKALAAVGANHVADAEASGMTRTLGQRVLLGLHAIDGDTAVVTFAMKPKWPGVIAFALMFVTGKWKTTRLTECVTVFDDDAYFITQYENPSPFRYGGTIDIERMPRATRVEALVARHRERVDAHKAAHPQARARPTTTLADMDANWRRGQMIKREYRRSVGYATEEELRAMLGAHYDRFAERIRAKIVEFAVDREANVDAG
jgi:tetratricopeptide (TPR) repeat protein